MLWCRSLRTEVIRLFDSGCAYLGQNDAAWNKGSETVAAACDPEKRDVYTHDDDHEVPSAKDASTSYPVVHIT
jgi:hypothetical protein